MRIAFVTPEYVTESNFDGGLANYIHRVSLSLLQLGHTPTVFVACDRNEHFVQNGIDVYRIKVATLWRYLFHKLACGLAPPILWMLQSLLLNRCLKKVHNINPFDIVEYTSYTAPALFRFKEVPSVIRISGFTPMIHEAHGHPDDCLQRILQWLEQRPLKRVDNLYGPSSLVANIVAEQTKHSVSIIESPFIQDVSKIDSTLYEDVFMGKEYLLFFGSISLLKGVSDIAQIIKQLLEENPKLYFAFVGKDLGFEDKPMLAYVKKMAGSTKDRVLYMNKMPHSQLYPIIDGALAIVLPSRFDNFPNVCIEAFAHKKIVVGTRGASFGQLIEDGINGFLCEAENPSSLITVIKKVLALTAKEREAIGTRAFKRLDDLRPETTVKKLLNYYQSVIELCGKSE